MAWQVLQFPKDWDDFRARIADERNVQRNLVHWGAGPQRYPCMVDGYMPNTTKVVCCYVYPEDIAGLIHSMENLGVPVPTQHQVAKQRAYEKAVAPLAEAVADPSQAATAVSGHTWKDFANSVTAHLLSQTHYLTETGICKPEEYEQTYQQFLAKVDQWSAEDREIALSKLSGAFPPPPEQA